MNRKFTKDEAQRIFSLAAERQQARQKEDDNQLSIEDLEEAGIAAGIDPAFIRSAASDLLRPDRITDQRKFLGFPVEFRESHVIPLAFNEANWKKSIDIFSLVYDKPGRAREIGSTKRWSSEQNDNQMPANIIAEEEEDGTRFTIERKTWPMTLGLGIASAVNLLIGLIFITLSMTVEPDLIIPGSILTAVGFFLGLGGTIGLKALSRQELKRFEQVFTYLEDMTPNQVLRDRTDTGEQPVSAKELRLSLDDVADEEQDTRRSIKPREHTSTLR